MIDGAEAARSKEALFTYYREIANEKGEAGEEIYAKMVLE